MPDTYVVPAHPGSSSPSASRRMSTVKRRDNDGEIAVRHLLHAAGFRYRVNYPVPGLRRRTIDIAFTRAKVAVFVDGCFWHGCPEHGNRPTANADWWMTKLAANAARDVDTSEHLQHLGWLVIRVWEHIEPAQAARIVSDAVRAPGGSHLTRSDPARSWPIPGS